MSSTTTAPPSPTVPDADEPTSLGTIVGIVVAVVAILNGLFFVVSKRYFADVPRGDELLSQARLAFALFSTVSGTVMIVTARAPRSAGHALAAITGAASVIGALGGAAHLPTLLVVTLLAAGSALLVLAARSYRSTSRAAWAFLCAIVGVLAVCTFFGAPKIRNELGISLWYALVVPVVLGIATYALGSLHRDYRD